MRHRADQEVHGREVRAPKFSLPVQLDRRIGFCRGQVAVHFGEESAAAARDQLIGLRILGRVTVGNHAWPARDRVDQATQHAGVIAELLILVLVFAFEECGTGIDDNHAEFAAVPFGFRPQ